MALWGNRDRNSGTGTIAIATNGAVTGTSTEFTTEAVVGNTIYAAGRQYVITSITSDTAATVEASINGGSIVAVTSGEAYSFSTKPVFVSMSESADSGIGNSGDGTKVFGVDVTSNEENRESRGKVVEVGVANGGTRYTEAPAVTFTGGGGQDAAATATISGGVVTSIAVTDIGFSYENVPTVAIAAPFRTIPTSGVTIATEQFAYTTHGLVEAESVKYFHGGGTAITGLSNNTEYFVSALGLAAGTFRLAASAAAAPGRANLTAPVATSGTGGQFTCGASTLAVGDRVVISGTNAGAGTITGYTTGTIYTVSAVTGTSPSVTGFTLTTEADVAIVTTAGTLTGLSFKPYTIVLISGTGNNAQYFEITNATTATAVAALGGGTEAGESESNITHTGWVRRTTGTGGRAGRVFYETLVAGGSITGDQSDDIQFPDD
jgi:hypothetical protein